MVEITQLQSYLQSQFGEDVEILEIQEMGGGPKGEKALKQFGYGRPLLIDFRLRGRGQKVVLHSVRRNAFGRERESDRVAAVWLDYRTFNRLSKHVRARDMLLQRKSGELESIADAETILLVTEFQPGNPYAEDLSRIRDQGEIQEIDRERVKKLAGYLADIHQVQHEDPKLWQRRIRDLIGHGEGILGLTDNYPDDLPFTSKVELRRIEEEANLWRWRIKPMDGRLRQVHGDYHPFNVLFDDGGDLHVLDRSRGEWGEPADDVSCMTINYLFFSLQRSGRFEEPLRSLHQLFWETYFAQRPDPQMLEVIQPWFAWRALVLASPVWYPTIQTDVRRKLLNFARQVMRADRYDYQNIEPYMQSVV